MILFYSKEDCPKCKTSKAKLDAAGVQYKPIVIGVDIERDRFVEENPNIRTVPHLMTEDRTITFQNVELAIEWARING